MLFPSLMEASGQVDALFGKFEAPIVSAILESEEAWQEKMIAPLIFRKVQSDHYGEAYISVTAADDWEPVGENGAHPNNGFTEGYRQTIENMTWKTRFTITREMADDGNITEMTQLAKRKANSYYRTLERFFASMLMSAANGNTSMTFGGKSFPIDGADGQALFYTAHVPKVSGANQSNLYADAFSASNLFKACTAMQNLKGENNETLDLNPDTIIIPNVATLKEAVYTAIASYQAPGTANNDINTVMGKLNVIVWPYLNDYLGSLTAPWILMDSQFMQEHDCAIWQERVPVEMKDKVGDNDEFIWDGYARFGGGFVDWRGLMCLGVTGGSNL